MVRPREEGVDCLHGRNQKASWEEQVTRTKLELVLCKQELFTPKFQWKVEFPAFQGNTASSKSFWTPLAFPLACPLSTRLEVWPHSSLKFCIVKSDGFRLGSVSSLGRCSNNSGVPENLKGRKAD